MRTSPLLLLSVIVLGCWSSACAAEALLQRQWTVDGVVREALVYVLPTAKSEATPVVFAFHGHGGSMQNAARSFHTHTLWPAAISVYMQGLKTPGRLTDPEGKKSGWQHSAGDQSDRDLKFFDAVMESLKHDFKVDERRIYSTGHSNGGAFTYLLWAVRGDRFAAFAPSGAAAPALLAKLKPKPVLHVAGENDPLVKFTWQKQTMDALRRLNQCGEGEPWNQGKWCTLYPSNVDAPLVTFIHPGGHKFPDDAPVAIVKFFQGRARP